MGLKVLGTIASIQCSRVEWGLKLKGLEYEYVAEDLGHKSPLVAKLNPVHKKVPVLVHDDKPLPESLIILEYIDDIWTHNRLMPLDPYGRAMARFWANFGDEKCITGTFEACKAQGKEKEIAIENAIKQLAFLENAIEGKKFFGGDEIGYLDLAIGWIGLWLGVMEEVGEMKILDDQRFPNLHRWSQNFIETPIIKQNSPSREILVEHCQGIVDQARSLSA